MNETETETETENRSYYPTYYAPRALARGFETPQDTKAPKGRQEDLHHVGNVHESPLPCGLQHEAEHHTVPTFKDEYLNLLRRHNIDFDERYVFDEEIIV